MDLNIDTVHEYWKDPSKAKDVRLAFRAMCVPEFFLGLTGIADVHRASRNLMGNVREFLPDKESSILELGCNVGRNLMYLHTADYENIYGVEISQRAVEVGEAYYTALRGKIEVSSIEDYLRGDPEQFDMVFTYSCLMHIHPDSNWIFPKMAALAKRFIFTNEVEATSGSFKYPRNYQVIFERLGFVQRKLFVCDAASPLTLFRVFEKN